MEETNFDDVARSTVQENEVYVEQPTSHQDMHFSYNGQVPATVLQNVSTTDSHFLESDPSLRQYELRMSNTDSAFSSGSYGDTPVLVTRGSTTKGPKGPLVCHVEGCQRDLSLEKKYYKRYRVCMEHLKMNAMFVDGELQRFCQQCGRFHELAKFDGDKRNCRERLIQHNYRRRKSKRDSGGSDGSWDDWGQDQPSGKVPKGRRSQRLIQKTGPASLWSPNGRHNHYSQTGHGNGNSEEGKGMVTSGIEMVDSLALGRLGTDMTVPSYSQFSEELGLTAAAQNSHHHHEVQSQERESFYNMVVHHVIPSLSPETTATASINAGNFQESGSNEIPVVSNAGSEGLGNLTTLLQVSEPASMMEVTPAVSLDEVSANAFPIISHMGTLQSVCVSTPDGNVPAVPMLVFPATSGGNHVNAVAIIPTAISSCQTILPLSWTGQDRQQTLPLPVQSAHPIEAPASVPPPEQPQRLPVTTTEPQSTPQGGGGATELTSLVNLALSASGINQSSSSSAALQSALSSTQLAQFQMLIARQMSIYQNNEIAPSTSQPSVSEAESIKHKNETKNLP